MTVNNRTLKIRERELGFKKNYKNFRNCKEGKIISQLIFRVFLHAVERSVYIISLICAFPSYKNEGISTLLNCFMIIC
jgi:hypothetical protein